MTICLLAILFLSCFESSAAGKKPEKSLKFAAELVQKEKFDRAVIYLRSLVRRNKKDFAAWNLLGVSYYHTGLPKRALKILKFAEKKLTGNNKAYNHYYQGLAYDALKNPKLATRYFQKVAVTNSIYADPSCFELSAVYYNARKAIKADKWTSIYMQRFPKGRYIAKVRKMKKALNNGRFGKKVAGVKKPNLEKALFKFSSLSLMDQPHYWFLQSGGKWLQESGYEPSRELGRQERGDEITVLDLRMGIGMGPFRRKSITAHGGYTYDQSWNSTAERMNAFTEEIDLAYFPFRPDLMERTHSFYGDARANLGAQFYTGIFIKFDFIRYGSVIDGPEPWSISDSYTANQVTTITPWVGRQWAKNHRSLIYWFFDKNIDLETPELSKMTYINPINSDENSFPVSIGISHSSDFPKRSTSFNLELYRYEFIFNDEYKDHSRMGVLGSIQHALIPTLDLDLTAGYYVDTYIQPRVRLKSCKFVEKIDGGSGGSPQSCPRAENGFLVSAELSWAYRQFYRLFGKIQLLSNDNQDLEEFGFEQISIVGGITLAFPSVKRTIRYSERFADRTLERGVRP